MYKVIGIVRISSLKQEMIEQKKELLEFIKHDGYTDDEIKIIEGEGASAIKMDELFMANAEKVRELINKGGIECVYAWAIDRIGRDEEFLMNFKKMLVKHSVNLKIKNPSLTLMNYDGTINAGMELAFSLYATMANQEMEQKKSRFKRSRKRNAEQGKWNGGMYVKFGYRLDENGFLVADEEDTAPLVRKVFSMYSTGQYSLTKIANEFKELGVEKLTSTVFLGRLLNYRGYLGECVGEKEKMKYPRLVSDEIFNTCQEILRTNNKQADKQYIHHYFGNKIVKCCDCGASMGACDLYFCHNGCGQRIKVDFLDGLLFQIAANEHLLFLARNSDLEADRLKNELRINMEKKSALEAQKDGYFKKIEKAKKLYMKDLLDDDELDEKIAEAKKEDADREKRVVEIVEKIESLEAQINALESNMDYEELLKLWDGVLNEQQESERQKIVKLHIKRCVVSGYLTYKMIEIELVNGQKMHFRYQPHVKFGKRLFRIDDGQEVPYLEYFVKRLR